jgi:hypothetical protein
MRLTDLQEYRKAWDVFGLATQAMLMGNKEQWVVEALQLSKRRIDEIEKLTTPTSGST